jgi:hypothetical protein
MTLITKDRVLETSTSTGAGDFALAGAVLGFRAFSAVCATNDTFYYHIEAIDSGGAPSGEWETGLGTYSAANTLTRTTVSDSSNAGAAVTFSAGTKRVAISAIALTTARWIEASWWDQAINGSAQSIECDVTGAKEIFITGNDLTNASVVQRIVQVSVDAGANWFTTSGNYDEVAAAGTSAVNAAFFPHTTAVTAARSIAVHIMNNGFGRIPSAYLLTRATHARFLGSTTVINRVRVTGSAGGTGTPAGSMNGGTIQFLVK